MHESIYITIVILKYSYCMQICTAQPQLFHTVVPWLSKQFQVKYHNQDQDIYINIVVFNGLCK